MIGFRDENETSNYTFDIDGDEAEYFVPAKLGELIEDFDEDSAFGSYFDALEAGKELNSKDGFEIITFSEDKEQIQRLKRY